MLEWGKIQKQGVCRRLDLKVKSENNWLLINAILTDTETFKSNTRQGPLSLKAEATISAEMVANLTG